MMATQEERAAQREKHHRPLTQSLGTAKGMQNLELRLREEGFEIPPAETQSQGKRGDNSSDGNAPTNNSRAHKENFMDQQTQQSTQQDQSTQTPPPAGGTEPMSAFQQQIRDITKEVVKTSMETYFTAHRGNVAIDVAAFAVKGAIVIGVVSAGLAIGKAILTPRTDAALPPAAG
jgi:hypothetical protein